MALEQAGVQLVAQGAAAFDTDMASASKAVAGFGAAADKSAVLAQDAAGRWRTSTGRFATDAEKAAAGVAPLPTAAKAAGDAAKKAGDDAEKGGHGFDVFGQIAIGALRKVGSLAVDAMAQASKATIGFLKDSVSVAGDFQQGMLNFQAVAGKDVDAKGLRQFHDLFIQLGKDLPVSTSEVEQAATEMVKGGIDPATIAAGGLKQGIQFAAAAMGGDLVKAAEISSKIVGGWSDVNATAADKAAFLTHATDMLTKAANASATDVEGLSRGIFNAQGIARTAGVPFDDLTTTLAELAPRFASSSEAGDSLKNMIARLQPTTKPATEAMQALGLYTDDTGSKFYDAQGNFIGFQKSSQLLQDSLKGLTKEQQAATLQQIFGNDAMGSASALAELGAQGYQNMADALTKANGVQASAALTQAGFNTSLENAKGSIEALQITIGEALLPVLGSLLNDYIAPGINAITDWTTSILKADDPLLAFTQSIDTLMPGLGSIIGYITTLVTEGDDMNDFLATTPALFQGLVSGVQDAIAEFSRLSDAFDTGGVSGMIDQLIADITAALPDIEAALAGWGQALVDWAIAATPQLFKALDDLLGQAEAWVKEQAPGWGRQLVAWANEFVVWIPDAIPPFLVALNTLSAQFIAWIGEQAQPLLKRLGDWASAFVAWIVPATVTFLAEWPKMFDQFLDWIGNAVGPLLKQLGDWALSFIQWIAPMIPPFLVALGGIALAIGVWVIETAAVLAVKIKDKWLPAIIGWIVTDAIPGLYNALKSFLDVIDDWVHDTERNIGEWMVDVGTSAVDGIKEGLSDAWGSLTHWLTDKAHSMVKAVLDAIGAGSPATEFMPVGQFATMGIMQGFESTWPQLLDLVSSLGDSLISQADSIASDVQDSIASAFGAGANIDRQKIKNLDALTGLSAKTQAMEREQFDQATRQAEQMADPKQAAEYFKLRSEQIIELGKLTDQIAKTTDEDEHDRLVARYQLINDAQLKEQQQLTAQQSGGGQLASLANNIRDLLNNASMPGILNNATVAQLAAYLDQITAQIDQAAHTAPAMLQGLANPVATPAQIASGGITTSYSQSTTLNMPVYTNQSPAVLQQSLAIAGSLL